MLILRKVASFVKCHTNHVMLVNYECHLPYLLLLISELVNKLQGAQYFTKLNVCWGFNNVQMKEGDEWKATFHTNHALFEPLVMFFGSTNSLATFPNHDVACLKG